eukprot:TRINITY_DN885_c0_g1_i3.p2 TRINITY_DN885_c0_g1~~TRINITY_DN885_c0_g1_i3.p2  ORF type:complete len:315 (+),score=-62.56 TRINITY_DN885_c0_g1_i3:1083-2027(+)
MNVQNSAEDKLIHAILREQKIARRWKATRFLLGFALLAFWSLHLLSPNIGKRFSKTPAVPYVSLLQWNGEIANNKPFSAEQVLPELQRAFSDAQSKGVLIEIDSPGGSPVQAGIIYDRIVYLKNKYKKKVVILGEDALASGAYLVASAADKIYVHPDTITGSIGVILSGFGFDQAIKKLGISRRVFSAGTHKDRLDPFTAVNPQDVQKANQVLTEVHTHFIDKVLLNRKDKLQAPLSQLFSGDFWTGSTALKLGLVDGLANSWTILQTEFKVSEYKNYSAKPLWLEAFLHKFSAALPAQWLSQKTSWHLRATLN